MKRTSMKRYQIYSSKVLNTVAQNLDYKNHDMVNRKQQRLHSDKYKKNVQNWI